MADGGRRWPEYMTMQKPLLRSLHLQDVLAAAVTQFAELGGGAKVAVFLADNESLALKLMASNGYTEATLDELRVLPFSAASLMQYVVQKRIPASVSSLDQAPDLTVSVMRREGSRAQIALPLIASSLLIGAVMLDLPDADVISQVEFLNDLADIVAMAVANSILYGRSQYERERLSTLYKTSCALGGSTLKVSEVLKIAADTALVVSNTPCGAVLLYDPARRRFGLAAFKGLDGSSLKELDLGLAGTVWGRCLKTGKTEYVAEAGSHGQGLPCATGGSQFGSLVAVPMIHDNEPLGVLVVFSTDKRAFQREQISMLESLSQQVKTALNAALIHETAAAQAIQDPHTGLYNRWHFEDSLNKEVERSQRHKRALALMLVDVDHLAQINEHLGQEKGDEAIKHVARVIRSTIRDIDLPCRYGGEEFGIILPETSYENARDVAERLRQNIRSAPAAGIGLVTVSIGMSSFPDNALESGALLRAAEEALDIAKFEGRDRVKVAQCGLPMTGMVHWQELARQAKLSVLSERQSKLRHTLAPEYAHWIGSYGGGKRPGEIGSADS